GDESEERGVGGEGGSLGALDAEVADACGTELGRESGGQRRRGLVFIDGRPIRACEMGHCRHVRIVPLGSAEYRAPLPGSPGAPRSAALVLSVAGRAQSSSAPTKVIDSLWGKLRTAPDGAIDSNIREFLVY